MEALAVLPQMRALVMAVHQLADRRRGSSDHARRQRGGEDIGAADQPQYLELRMVGDAEAPHSANALGEGADHEIDIVQHALILGDATAIGTDEAHRMGLIDQHHRASGLGDGNHLLQRRDVAEHRIDAFKHDQFAGALGDAAEALLQRADVVVAEGDNFRVAHLAPVIDRGVAVDVEDDIIALAGDGGDDAEIGLIAGREHHGMIHGVEVLQRVLAGLVAGIGAVEDAAAGRARAEFVERLLAGGDDVVVERHAQIIVGAEEDRLPAVADRAGGGEDLFHHQPERVPHAGGEQALAHLDQGIELAEEINGLGFGHSCFLYSPPCKGGAGGG